MEKEYYKNLAEKYFAGNITEGNQRTGRMDT